MTFRSSARSNVNRYIQAGNAAASAGVEISGGIAANRPRFDKIEDARMQVHADLFEAAIDADAKVAKAGMSIKAAREQRKAKEKAEKKIRASNKSAAMAGKLAAGAQAIGLSQYVRNQKQEENPLLDLYQQQLNKTGSKLEDVMAKLDALNSGQKTEGTNPSSSIDESSPSTSSTNSYGGLTGVSKTIADAVAKPESGGYGYEAFNQGGAAGGTKVVGKSGNYSDTYGSSLTDMTLSEIFHKQNTKQRGLSMQEHLDQGGLHAVGRYQFIGPTLQEEVRLMGIDPETTKFTPEIQDKIFLNHIKRVGNVSPWVGTQNYSQTERDRLNNLISQL